MAKHLNKKDVTLVKSILDTWEGKLSWDLLSNAFEQRSGRSVARQTLASNELIKQAFDHRKNQLKLGSLNTKTPQSLATAAQRIARLENENARLIAENSRLLEMFELWQYNAYKHNLSDDQLNEPKPKVDRRS